MIPDDDKTREMTVLSKGTDIDHYRIAEKIGARGMGGLYLQDQAVPLFEGRTEIIRAC
jgi:hypothetical protein